MTLSHLGVKVSHGPLYSLGTKQLEDVPVQVWVLKSYPPTY